MVLLWSPGRSALYPATRAFQLPFLQVSLGLQQVCMGYADEEKLLNWDGANFPDALEGAFDTPSPPDDDGVNDRQVAPCCWSAMRPAQ